MKALFITLNGENLYHHNGKVRTSKRPMPRLLRWALIVGTLDLVGILYLLLR